LQNKKTPTHRCLVALSMTRNLFGYEMYPGLNSAVGNHCSYLQLATTSPDSSFFCWRSTRQSASLPLPVRHDAAGGKIQPTADESTGLNTPKRYTLSARDFWAAGPPGPDGGDTQVGPERMFWTASARGCCDQTILGGAGT
jgi:hypothetical protein